MQDIVFLVDMVVDVGLTLFETLNQGGESRTGIFRNGVINSLARAFGAEPALYFRVPPP